MKPKILKISNSFKLKLDPFYSSDLKCWQMSIPHLSLYKSEGAMCFIINLMFIDVQFWFGKVEELT